LVAIHFHPGIGPEWRVAVRTPQLERAVPMRKLLSAFTVMLLMTGIVVAAEGTLKKVDLDNNQVTITEGDKDTTYKINDKVKVTLITGKKGEEKETEGKYEDWTKRLKNFKADSKFGNKITFEAKDGTITEVKIRGGGKKTKTN
jgi:5'-3' exonuclease